MKIEELHFVSDKQVGEVILLMKELNPEIPVTPQMVRNTVENSLTHFFVMKNNEGAFIGSASLGVFDTPTGRKAHVEDVVVKYTYRGQGLGKKLMEHVIEYARHKLGDVNVYLTSHPSRVEANQLYKSLGFKQRETNVYKLEIKNAYE